MKTFLDIVALLVVVLFCALLLIGGLFALIVLIMVLKWWAFVVLAVACIGAISLGWAADRVCREDD